MKKWLAIGALVLLASCSAGLDGTYSDGLGVTSYTFQRDGKVIMKVMGIETEADYRVEDGKVKLQSPSGTLVMTLLEDGSIQGPLGIRLTKRAE